MPIYQGIELTLKESLTWMWNEPMRVGAISSGYVRMELFQVLDHIRLVSPSVIFNLCSAEPATLPGKEIKTSAPDIVIPIDTGRSV